MEEQKTRRLTKFSNLIPTQKPTRSSSRHSAEKDVNDNILKSFYLFREYLGTIYQPQLAKFIINNITPKTLKEVLSSDHPLILMINARPKLTGDQILSFLQKSMKKDELISIILQSVDHNTKIEFRDFINLAKERYETKEEKKKAPTAEDIEISKEMAKIASLMLDKQIQDFADFMDYQEGIEFEKERLRKEMLQEEIIDQMKLYESSMDE
jgi:hypothetical protein